MNNRKIWKQTINCSSLTVAMGKEKWQKISSKSHPLQISVYGETIKEKTNHEKICESIFFISKTDCIYLGNYLKRWKRLFVGTMPVEHFLFPLINSLRNFSERINILKQHVWENEPIGTVSPVRRQVVWRNTSSSKSSLDAQKTCLTKLLWLLSLFWSQLTVK